jgi:hypothetical protein
MVVTASKLLMLVACILFVLAAFHVGLPIEIVPLGLAFMAASFLVP